MHEYETRYHTKLDTVSKMTALKILINREVSGEQFIAFAYEQDETEYQERRK